MSAQGHTMESVGFHIWSGNVERPFSVFIKGKSWFARLLLLSGLGFLIRRLFLPLYCAFYYWYKVDSPKLRLRQRFTQKLIRCEWWLMRKLQKYQNDEAWERLKRMRKMKDAHRH